MNTSVKDPMPLKSAVKSAVRRNHPWNVVRFALHLPNFARLFFRLMRDGRVAWGPKVLLLATLAYVFSPLDFIPDVMPLLGEMDDLAILGLGCKMFLSLCPRSVIDEHVAEIDRSGNWMPFG